MKEEVYTVYGMENGKVRTVEIKASANMPAIDLMNKGQKALGATRMVAIQKKGLRLFEADTTPRAGGEGGGG